MALGLANVVPKFIFVSLPTLSDGRLMMGAFTATVGIGFTAF
jgi:hypothetical protein